MRLMILTQDAPVYLAPFLDDVLTRLSQTEHQIVACVSLPPFFKASRWDELRDRWHFYGPWAFTQMLAYILVTRLRGWVDPAQSVNGTLKKHGIPRLIVENVNSPDFIDHIQQAEVDLLVSVAFPKILKPPLLAAPRWGCINYHTALLPYYRGRQPLFWAMLHNEPEVGITVHEMDASIDSGPIISQTRLPIAPQDSLHSLYQRTIRAGAPLLVAAIQKLAQGDTHRLPNPTDQGSYFSFPTPQDARRFRDDGHRFF